MPNNAEVKPYKTKVNEVTGLAASVGNFYTMFAGTPVADIIYDINHTLYDMNRNADVDETFDMEEAEEDAWIPIENVESHGSAGLEDKTFREKSTDLRINSLIDRIDLHMDHYPEGTIERDMLEYTRWALDKLRNRELVFSVRSREDQNELPVMDVMSKFANYSFIPKLPERIKEHLPQDNANYFFSVNEDQEKRAKYTKDELQESADNLHFSDIYKAGRRYADTLIEVNNLMGRDNPPTPGQQEILKDKLLADTVNLKNELLKAYHSDMEDPVSLRMFGDVPAYMEDGIRSDGRGYGANLRKLTDLEKYLNSGLPLSGYPQYLDMCVMARTITDGIDDIDKYLENAGDFKKTASELVDIVNNPPKRGASKEEIEGYNHSLVNSMRKCTEEYYALRSDLKLIAPSPDLSEEEKKAFRFFQNKARDNILQDTTMLGTRMKKLNTPGGIKGLGTDKKSIHKDWQGDYLEGLEKDRQDFNKELKNLKKANKGNITYDTMEALDELIKVTDAKSEASPEKIKAAFAALKTAADKEYAADVRDIRRHEQAGKVDDFKAVYAMKKGMDTANHIGNLKQYVDRTIAYYNNRLTGAKERGLNTDETVTRQQELIQRNGTIELEQALNRFNTVPKRWVGSPKESTMHRITREAVEKLQSLRQEFADIDQDAQPDQWRQKAAALMDQAKLVSDLSKEYVMGKTGMFDNKERIHGGEDLHKEAELLRISLKNRLDLDRKCTAIKENTHKVEPINVEDIKKAVEEKKEAGRRADFNNAKASIEELNKDKIKPASKDASDAKKVHNINFDDMMKKHGVGEAKKKATQKAAHSEVKRAVKQDAPEKKGPSK